MTDTVSFRLGDFPEEERGIYAEAMMAGQSALLRYLLMRAGSYHELVELELEENPAAGVYLRDGSAALSRAQGLLPESQVYEPTSEFESFDLSPLLRGVEGRLGRAAVADIQLSIDCDSSQILGHIVLLQQALMQLPALAQSVGGSGRLTVSLWEDTLTQKQCELRGTSLTPGTYLVLDVGQPAEDDWIALPELAALEPSLPVDDRLRFVLGAARLHGGDLLCARANQLASLRLFLPPSNANSSQSSELSDDDLMGSETILLVDDEAIIWDLVIDMLQSLGYTVILASTGKECVEIYAENPGEIDLVLLDMIMPEMNGYNAYFALQKIDPRVQVLLSSGYVAEDDAQDVLAAGAAGFLKKPYRMVDLAKKIRHILGPVQ